MTTSFSPGAVAAQLLDDPLFRYNPESEQEDAARAAIKAAGVAPNDINVSIVLRAALDPEHVAPVTPKPVVSPAATAPRAAAKKPETPQPTAARRDATPSPSWRPGEPLIHRLLNVGLNEIDVAKAMGVSRATVNAWRYGRGAERYTATQRQSLGELLAKRQNRLQRLLDELDGASA